MKERDDPLESKSEQSEVIKKFNNLAKEVNKLGAKGEQGLTDKELEVRKNSLDSLIKTEKDNLDKMVQTMKSEELLELLNSIGKLKIRIGQIDSSNKSISLTPDIQTLENQIIKSMTDKISKLETIKAELKEAGKQKELDQTRQELTKLKEGKSLAELTENFKQAQILRGQHERQMSRIREEKKRQETPSEHAATMIHKQEPKTPYEKAIHALCNQLEKDLQWGTKQRSSSLSKQGDDKTKRLEELKGYIEALRNGRLDFGGFEKYLVAHIDLWKEDVRETVAYKNKLGASFLGVTPEDIKKVSDEEVTKQVFANLRSHSGHTYGKCLNMMKLTINDERSNINKLAVAEKKRTFEEVKSNITIAAEERASVTSRPKA